MVLSRFSHANETDSSRTWGELVQQATGGRGETAPRQRSCTSGPQNDTVETRKASIPTILVVDIAQNDCAYVVAEEK